MISVYAVVDAPALDVSDLRGVDGAPVVSVASAGMAAVGSAHDDGADLRPRPERLWSHDGVVSALMARATVVPIRYGTVIADLAALGELLVAERHWLARSLDAVRGRVELGVRGVLTDPGRPAATAPGGVEPSGEGSAYLRARHAALRQRRPLEAVHAALAPMAERSTVSFKHDGTMVSAYLVSASEAGRLAAAAAEIDSSDESVTLSVTGPWAGYSFVGGPADA